MQTISPIIPASYDYLFDKVADKLFAEYLARYLLFDEEPIPTPAIWQDVVIYIRFKQRDVWTLRDEQITNANYAILIYQVKYTIEHLKKPEILKTLNQFLAQTPDQHENIFKVFEQKLHASLNSLLFTQEKLTITKDMVKDLDQLFAYPCWLEFTNEANQVVFDKILEDKLSDEQIDYFLGANDHITHYDQWFNIIKHILKTTHDSHTFWTAGDVLSIIWKAIPEDDKSQKWFRDQVFDIFWPRVGSTWPLLNEATIDFDHDEDSRILKDSIGWLQVLDDLKKHLPELGDDYETYERNTDQNDFSNRHRLLLHTLKSSEDTVNESVDLFLALADCAYNDEAIATLETIATDQLIPLVNNSLDDPSDAVKIINRAIKHAKSYVKNLTHERDNLTKNLISS